MEAMTMIAPSMSATMESGISLRGSIIDSWLEGRHANPRVVLQIAPRNQPGRMWILEAPASMVGDRYLLEDLEENLCHGSLVDAVGQLDRSGFFQASRLRFTR